MAHPRNREKYLEARRLRREHGMPLRRIASRLGVSVSTVSAWTSDIELSPEERRRNLSGPRGPQSRQQIAHRVAKWTAKHRERRREWQEAGRRAARRGNALHQAGCMLYWAEGAKDRNAIVIANSDREMLRLFRRFLSECLGVGRNQITVRLNVYLTNGLTLRAIEDHWLWALDLPRSALRKHQINHHPTSSSGRKRNKLPFGVLHASGEAEHPPRPAHLRCDPGVRRVRGAALA